MPLLSPSVGATLRGARVESPSGILDSIAAPALGVNDASAGRSLPYPFTEPMKAPATKYRWAAKYTTTRGTAVMTTAAIFALAKM